MLNTYFNIKSTPAVESLDDIWENKDLVIAGIPDYLPIVANDYNIDDILARMRTDPDNFPDPILSKRIAKKVINGKSVLIGNSYQRSDFLKQNKKYHYHLVVVHKNLPDFMTYFVRKHLPIAEVVHF